MKKILILHANNTYNNGSFMMLINLIYYLQKEFKEKIYFFIKLNCEGDYIKLRKELPPFIKLIPFNFKKQNKSSGFLNILIGLKYKLFDQIEEIKTNNFDSVIILGGDDLSEYYKKWQIFTELLIIKKLTSLSKVYLIGQTIGPFYSWRKIIAKNTLSKCKIYTRDSLSSNYLEKKLKIKDVFESSDLAFLALPLQKKRGYSLKDYQLKKEEYITIVPSGLINQYTPNIKDYLDAWEMIIKNLLSKKKLAKKKIIILPHVTKPKNSSDILILNELKTRLHYLDKKRLIFINKDLSPSEARFILGNGLFTITGRMHAAISAFQMGKPAISLSYSVKYAGIIGKDLDRSDLIIESANEHLWSSEEIIKKLDNKIEYLLINYPKLQKEIIKKVKFLKIKALSQIKDITKYV